MMKTLQLQQTNESGVGSGPPRPSRGPGRSPRVVSGNHDYIRGNKTISHSKSDYLNQDNGNGIVRNRSIVRFDDDVDIVDGHINADHVDDGGYVDDGGDVNGDGYVDGDDDGDDDGVDGDVGSDGVGVRFAPPPVPQRGC